MILVLGLFIVGLLLSAFFSGSETGFYRVTRVRLAIEALSGNRMSQALLWLSSQPTLFVATALVGNNLANYIVSLSVVMGTQRMYPSGSTLVDVMGPIVIAPVVFLFGELLPKKLFYEAPNRLLKRCAPPLLFCTILFAPISALLWIFGRVLQVLTKASPQQLRVRLARRELTQLIAEGQEAGILKPIQRSLAQAMLAVAAQPVRNFAASSGRVVRVTTTMTKSDVLRIAQRHERTLLPVEDPKQKRKLVGYFRVVDLYMDNSAQLPTPLPLVPLRESQSCLAALRLLNHADDPLGHVIAADGKTVGFLTGRELRMALLRAQ